MKKILENVGFDWAFFFLSLLAYGILGLWDFGLLRNALSTLAGLAAKIVPVLMIVFGLMFLANRFLENKDIERFLGKGSGVRGWVVAIVGGILSSGPIYMWYPLLGDLKEKGMKDSLIAAFLYNRAIKIPLLPMVVYYFEWRFALILSIYMAIFSVANGVLVQFLTRGGSEG